MQTMSKEEKHKEGRGGGGERREEEEEEEEEEEGLLGPEESVSSVLTIPCVHEGQILGVLAAVNSVQGSFRRCEEAAKRIGRSVSVRLRGQREVAEVKEALRQQRRLWELAMKLAEAEDERQVAELVSFHTPKLLGCDSGTLLLLVERSERERGEEERSERERGEEEMEEEERVLRNLSGGQAVKKKFTARGFFLKCLSSKQT
eukprot:332715-Hanusia_phi.AAC.2